MSNEGKCPVMHGSKQTLATGDIANRNWWPNQISMKVLNQNAPQINPLGEAFDYAEEFKSLDLKALKKDLTDLMTDSRTGGRPTMVIMAVCSCAWHGTARAPTAPMTDAAAPHRARSVSHRSIAGRTTETSTRPVVCCGRSSKSTGRKFLGLT